MKALIDELDKLLVHYEYAASKITAHKEAYKGMVDVLKAVKQLAIAEQERITKIIDEGGNNEYGYYESYNYTLDEFKEKIKGEKKE